jgi:Zn-dependent peptidase ImmA (M78 family)
MFEDDTEYEAYRGHAHRRMEREAERFAADLVMPAPLVREAFRADPSLAHLVRVFDVSEAAMRIRLEELRLSS